MLWLKGKAGSAKSTLMKQAVQRFENQEKALDALMAKHFFNARGVALERNFRGLLQSLLYQLLDQVQPLLEEILPIFRKKKTHSSGWEWHTGELRGFMLSISRSRPLPLWIYIDALDECDESERQDVVWFLQELMQNTLSHQLKIFFSSRHFPYIDIRGWETINAEDHNGNDISAYINQHLGTLQDKNGLSEIILEVQSKAQGVFLWVVLVVKILLKNPFEPVGVKRRKLQHIPLELSHLFKTIMEEMDGEECENMCLIVQWVLFAESPLTPKELFTAIVFDNANKYPSFKAWQESNMFIEDQSQIEGLLLLCSRGLIEVSRSKFHYNSGASLKDDQRGTGIVQFIHESVRGFFLNEKEGALAILDPSLRENFVGNSHDRLARSCVNFLSIEELRGRDGKPNSELKILMGTNSKSNCHESENEGSVEDSIESSIGVAIEDLSDEDAALLERLAYSGNFYRIESPELPFHNYALHFVFVHAQHAETNGINQGHLVDLFSRYEKEVFKSWVISHDKKRLHNHGPRPALLCVVSFYHLPSCVELMLLSGEDPNSKCLNDDQFPLIIAATLGFIDIVRLLVLYNANTEARAID